MTERDIYNTQAWNFLQGDRAVEGALRELGPAATLVVRNQLGNVLATVAGIRDLRHMGWGEGVEGPIWVPENALRSARPEPEQPLPSCEFFAATLRETYGVQVPAAYAPLDDELVLVLNMTEDRVAGGPGRAVLARVVQALKSALGPVLFAAPRGARLATDLRPFAATAWSTQHWEGRNAFASAAIEEAVQDATPRQITVMGLNAEHVFYTAIGAADYFIAREGRGARQLQLWELLELGARVRVPADCTAWPPAADEGARPYKELALEHLARDLKVASTAASPRFQATGESIAMDILG